MPRRKNRNGRANYRKIYQVGKMKQIKKVLVKLDKRHRNKAEKFAEERMGEVSHYKRRGGVKHEDMIVGAMAEMAVFRFLKKNKIKTNEPDFTIHDKTKKSYKADLRSSQSSFHVKGQSGRSAKLYGNSWLMQRNDPLVKESVNNNYIVPCAVDLDSNEVWIYGFVSFSTLHYYGCFGECVNPMFRHSKVAIYLDSLKNLSHNARWGLLKKSKK